MQIKKIHSELSSYEDIIQALENERRICAGEIIEEEMKDYPIVYWDTFSYKGEEVYPSSVYVGELPRKLVDIGFAQDLVYDLSHIRAHMKTDDVEHGHNGTIDDLRKLPHMISNPVCIISSDPKRDKENKNYQPLIMLSVDREWTKDPLTNAPNEAQVYRMAIVHPDSTYKGLVNQCPDATKVQTYYKITKQKFNWLIDNGFDREAVVYFDNEQYMTIKPSERREELETLDSFSEEIFGKYGKIPQKDEKFAAFVAKKEWAYRAEINKYLAGITHETQTGFPLLQESIRTIGRSSNLDDVMQANGVLRKCWWKYRDSDAKCAKEKLEVNYAKAIARSVPKSKEKLFTHMKQSISQTPVISDSDLDDLYNDVQELVDAYDIHFKDDLKNKYPIIEQAEFIVDDFVKEMANVLGDAVYDLGERYEQQKEIIRDTMSRTRSYTAEELGLENDIQGPQR